MTTELKTVRVIPYGRLDRMQTFASGNIFHPLRVSKKWKPFQHTHELWHLLIAFSDELDEGFAKTFRKIATSDTKLLVLNDGKSSDKLLSRIIDLQIRSPHRFYVADPPYGPTTETIWEEVVHSLLGRLTAALVSKGLNRRIFDANIDDGILHLISADFQRLDVPLSKIKSLDRQDPQAARNFEIDEDGSYLYWPNFDLHLGWEQLEQIIDPIAAQKAKQKSTVFNLRYGAAIRALREDKGLALNTVPGLSEKQLRRIERGECRLTSRAAEKLAEAHRMNPNQYLQSVAALLK